MLNLRGIFRPKSDDKEIIALNLEVPAYAVPPSKAPLQAEAEAAAKKAASDEIARRTNLFVRAGKFPGIYFYGADACSGSVVLFKGNDKAQITLPVFSSPLLARDFLRAIKNPSGIAGFNMDHLLKWQPRWKAMGITSICLNRCAHSSQNTIITPKDGQITKDLFAQAWAIGMATRSFRGETLVRQFLAQKGDKAVSKQREILENLRDHVDSSIPYVHWLIAMYAGIQGDEEARLAATARLQEFGGEFATKDTRSRNPTEDKSWANDISTATIGLLANFGMLQLKNAPPGATGETQK